MYEWEHIGGGLTGEERLSTKEALEGEKKITGVHIIFGGNCKTSCFTRGGTKKHRGWKGESSGRGKTENGWVGLYSVTFQVGDLWRAVQMKWGHREKLQGGRKMGKGDKIADRTSLLMVGQGTFRDEGWPV